MTDLFLDFSRMLVNLLAFCSFHMAGAGAAPFFEKFDRYLSKDNTGSEIPEELHDIMSAATKLPKAPWEEGICKVCGIYRDDPMFSCVIIAT